MVQSRRKILRDGLVAGLIGAGSVAAWFLIVDIVAGRPFFTPAVLGSAVFWGLRDAMTVIIGFRAVAAYTVIHVLAFVLVGTIASQLLSEVEKDSGFLWLLVEFFVALEFGFHATIALVFTPLLSELAWLNVGIGNLIAAGVMGYYFWRVMPALHRGSDQRPLDAAENDNVARGAREAGARTGNDDESASAGH